MHHPEGLFTHAGLLRTFSMGGKRVSVTDRKFQVKHVFQKVEELMKLFKMLAVLFMLLFIPAFVLAQAEVPDDDPEEVIEDRAPDDPTDTEYEEGVPGGIPPDGTIFVPSDDTLGAGDEDDTGEEPTAPDEGPDLEEGGPSAFEGEGTAEADDEALGAGDADTAAEEEVAVLETIGENRVRFSEVDGFQFEGGSVEDLILDRNGNILFVVVDLDDTEGAFLVPPTMISFVSEAGGVHPVLNLGAAGTGTIEQTGSEGALTADQTAVGAIYASDLVDYDVRGAGDEDAGSVADLVIDLESGSIAYLAIGQGGFLGIGEDLVAVSMDQVQVSPENGTVALSMTAEEFENLEPFDAENWPVDAGGTLGAGEESGAGLEAPVEAEPETDGAGM
jgi:sporulation protein YlmC with PRC-barrel domain